MPRIPCKDYLIVSDVDRTLNNVYRRTVQQNLDAVADFTSRGGNFTIASGRNIQSAARIYNKLNVRTPFIFMNGAGIYDAVNTRLLSYKPISGFGQNRISEISQLFPHAEIVVFSLDTVYYIKPRIFGYSFIMADKLKHEICGSLSDVPWGGWGKVTFFDLPENVRLIQSMINDDPASGVKAVLTSPVTLEMMNDKVNKGTAVRELADILGIDIKNTCGIGDYYNDLEMLGVVGFPACCGQAPESVKAAAEYCTCHTNKGAVADLIYYLLRNYID